MDLSLQQLVAAALAEDQAQHDVTTALVVPPHARCRTTLVAKAPGVFSGAAAWRAAFDAFDAVVDDYTCAADGTHFGPGTTLAAFTGHTAGVLRAERVALNFVQRLSGVATLAAQFVAAVAGTRAQIVDTRKTTPLLRALEKRAVQHGGARNHRFGLQDGVLIKENHIAAAGGIAAAIESARAGVPHLLRIEIEVREVAGFEQALAAGADVVLLDNMELGAMREAVRLAEGTSVQVEASGNMTLERVRAVAETGVDFISVGALTHSAPAIDLSLLIDHG